MKRRGMIWILWLIFALSLPVLASEGAAAEEQGSPNVFEGYYGEAIWTIVWFFVLLVVLKKFAWKPLLNGLKGRQEYIEKQISDAEKTRGEAKKVLDEYNAKLADADRQGKNIIAVRTKEAETEAQKVKQNAQRELEQKKVRAEADLERERIDAEESLWGQASDIIRHLGKEVFGKTLDDADNQKLIDEAVARLKEQNNQ